MQSALNGTIGSTNNNKLKQSIVDSTKQARMMKRALNLTGIAYGLKKTFDGMRNIAQANIDMIEANNLFEVSMGKVVDEYGNLDESASEYYVKAMAFQDEMNKKLATNKAELKKYQAMYYSMLKSQGINKDASYFMSENLTKAGYDIASLYNLSVEDAMNKLKSGLSGQVESLRKIGIDVSESALAKVLKNAGIERSVQQLSYAEKEIARYIAIVDQAGQAQGDFAKTFEQPANQLRVLKNQFEELKQVAGSFIVNAFGGVIVWLNAIIMAVKEILRAFASLFGWDLDSGGANLSESLGIEDVSTGLGNATKKAKEFKKQIMGFDEINNIEKPSSSKGGAGGVASGIDDKLLKSLKEWDNKMKSISGKAQEIRDRILEFVGLADGVPKTFKEWWKRLGAVQKTLIIITGIIAGIYVVGKITKIVNWIGKLIKVLGGAEAPVTTFGYGLQTIGKIASGIKSGFVVLVDWAKKAITQYSLFREAGFGVIDSLQMTNGYLNATNQGFLSIIPTTVKVVGGLAGLASSSVIAYKSMQDLESGTITAGEGLLKLTGSLAGATASGALLGSVIPGVGTAIGAVTGLVIAGTTAFIGYINCTEEVKDDFNTIGESAENFITGIASAKSHLDSFNTALFASSEEQVKLQENMNEIQSAITSICKTASDERRSLTSKEIETLDKYFEKLRELKNREIEIQNQISKAITQQAKTNAEAFKGSLDEYKIQSQEWIKTAEEQSDKTIEIIKKGTIEEIALLNQRYGDSATMQNEAYAKEYDKIIKQRDLKIQQAQDEVAKVNEAYAKGYLERSKTDESFYKTLSEFQEKQRKLEEAHNTKIQQIKDGELWYVTNTYQAIESENSTFAFHRKETWKEMYKNMSDEQAKELGIWLAMVSQTEMYGGKISDETQEMVDTILASYEDMPKGTKKAMKNAMQPMLDEMEKKEPSLFKKAKNIAEGILSRLNKAFDIHSPSRKTRQIFRNVMLGMEEGIEDEEHSIFKATDNFSQKVLSNLDFADKFKAINQGIKINTKDMQIDTNQHINYSAISGKINTMTGISINNNLIQGIITAVKQGMSEADVNVNIEAKTDEGVIVKKASEGFKEYVMQTGELPFPVPV